MRRRCRSPRPSGAHDHDITGKWIASSRAPDLARQHVLVTGTFSTPHRQSGGQRNPARSDVGEPFDQQRAITATAVATKKIRQLIGSGYDDLLAKCSKRKAPAELAELKRPTGTASPSRKHEGRIGRFEPTRDAIIDFVSLRGGGPSRRTDAFTTQDFLLGRARDE